MFVKPIDQNFYLKSMSYGLVLFAFFITQIITNNIKTSIVVFNTEDLITSAEKLFENKRSAMWLDGEGMLIKNLRFSSKNIK